jgi:hypothetical protein
MRISRSPSFVSQSTPQCQHVLCLDIFFQKPYSAAIPALGHACGLHAAKHQFVRLDGRCTAIDVIRRPLFNVVHVSLQASQQPWRWGEQPAAKLHKKQENVPVDISRSIFVRNLPYSATEDELEAFFSKVGVVVRS